MRYSDHARQRMAERGIDPAQVDIVVAHGRRSTSGLHERVDFGWLMAKRSERQPTRIDHAFAADGLTVILATAPFDTVITVYRARREHAVRPLPERPYSRHDRRRWKQDRSEWFYRGVCDKLADLAEAEAC